MSRIYIASKTYHAPRWRAFRDTSKVPIISRWIDDAIEPKEEKDFRMIWLRIMEDLQLCTHLVFYAKLEDFGKFKGALVEVGAALVLHKEVIVCLPQGQPSFVKECLGSWYHHPLVSRNDSIRRVFSQCLP